MRMGYGGGKGKTWLTDQTQKETPSGFHSAIKYVLDTPLPPSYQSANDTAGVTAGHPLRRRVCFRYTTFTEDTPKHR